MRVDDGIIETPDFVISTKTTPDEETLIEKTKFPYTKQSAIVARLQELANFMAGLNKSVVKEIIDDCTEPLGVLYEQIFGDDDNHAHAQVSWNEESIDMIKYYMQERLYVALVQQAKTNPALRTELEDLTHQDTTIYNLNTVRCVTEPKDIINLWLKYDADGKDAGPLRSFLGI